MRLFAEGIVGREGVDALAGQLGYSPRHLNRLLVSELGAGPLALARSNRAHTARMLLVGTNLPVADVAFSSGFGSVRQCNDTIREVFGMTPTALRSRLRGLEPAPGAIDLALPVREPFDAAGLFQWMAARAIDGVEAAARTSFSRTLRLPGGTAWFELSAAESAARDPSGHVRLRARVTDLADLGGLVARARRLFDLDADPQGIDAALVRHPELAPLVVRTPGIRVPGAADPHEMLIRALVGQQITVASARTALTRLVRALGRPLDAPEGEPRMLFPDMATIAERGAEVLRGPATRIRAIVDTAAALAEGALELSSADDGEEQRAALLARRGIGPWTADYVRMRVSGDPDILLPGDAAIRAGARAAGLPAAAKELVAWSERTAPWRSYLSAHLWRAAAEKIETKKNEV